MIARRRSSRALLPALASALLALALGPAGAGAASPPGPSTFVTGLVDNPSFQFSDQATRSLWLGRARALGSSFVRIDVNWSAIAPAQDVAGFQAADPSDPHYSWATLDATVKTAVADHQTVMLMLYDAPLWAEAPNPPAYATPGSWEPNATDYGAFAHAIAQRYSGSFPDPAGPGHALPRVTYFQAWNEPNLTQYLAPQWVTGPHNSIVAYTPGMYRSLLNALYAAVTSVQPHSYILAAGTAPYGDPPGVDRMRPLTFLEGLLCLTASLGPAPCPDPAHFDALDHHPYALTPTIHARVAGDISVPDLGQIWKLLAAAGRSGRALPTGPKSLWDTEIDWSTDPSVSAPVSVAEQARYVSEAFYELWEQGVNHVFWFDLRDPLSPQFNSDTDTGLYYQSGAAKPSATAFRFPFVALPQPHSQRIIWGRAPRAGVVLIQKAVGRGWQTVLTLHTTGGGVFYTRSSLGPSLLLRATLAGVSSLPWSPR